MAIAAAAVLAVAVGTPLMTIPGREPGTTMIGTAREIWLHGQAITALVLALCVLIAPAGYVASMLIVLVETRRTRAPHRGVAFLRATQLLLPWSMLDVMMLAVIVALTKLMEMTTVFAGVGIYALGAAVVLLMMLRTTFDRREAWNRVEWLSGPEQPTVAGAPPTNAGVSVGVASAAQAGLVSCTACDLVVRPAAAADPGHCPRCGARLAWRREGAIQKTWAFIVAAAICYVPANTLPMLVTHALGSSQPVTVIGGAQILYETGSWLLALIVIVASVMIPLAKLLVLAYLAITVQVGSAKSPRERTRLYRLVDVLGRWSMLDVFVDGIMAAAAQLPPLLVIEPGPGLPFFMAVVVLTVLAARSFDTRLIWDAGVAHG